MRLSIGNKNFRVSFGKNGIGYSAGTRGMRVSHRAGSNIGCLNGLTWIFIGPFVLVYYIMKYMIIGIVNLIKFIVKKIKANADAPDIEEAEEEFKEEV
jgi:hypothetical protein